MTSKYKHLILSTLSTLNVTSISGETSNGTTTPYNWKPFDEAGAVISYILFVAIVIPNGYVIFTLHTKVRSRTRLHFFILHLAYADFLVGTFVVLSDAIHSSLYGAWYGGDVFCRIYRSVRVLLLIASNNLLIGMSVDRFIAIKWPMKFVRVGSKLDKALVIGAWVLSVIIAVFYLPFTKGNDIYCSNNFPKGVGKPFITILSIAVYILPTIVIVVCYSGICLVVWRKWKQSYKLTELNDRRDSGSGVLPKAKIKSIKMTLVICLAFFICWTPYFVIILLKIYRPHLLDPGWNMLLMLLYPLNSAANPVIFIMFSLDIFCKCKEGTVPSEELDTTQPTTV